MPRVGYYAVFYAVDHKKPAFRQRFSSYNVQTVIYGILVRERLYEDV